MNLNNNSQTVQKAVDRAIDSKPSKNLKPKKTTKLESIGRRELAWQRKAFVLANWDMFHGNQTTIANAGNMHPGCVNSIVDKLRAQGVILTVPEHQSAKNHRMFVQENWDRHQGSRSAIAKAAGISISYVTKIVLLLRASGIPLTTYNQTRSQMTRSKRKVDANWTGLAQRRREFVQANWDRFEGNIQSIAKAGNMTSGCTDQIVKRLKTNGVPLQTYAKKVKHQQAIEAIWDELRGNNRHIAQRLGVCPSRVSQIVIALRKAGVELNDFDQEFRQRTKPKIQTQSSPSLSTLKSKIPTSNNQTTSMALLTRLYRGK